VLSVVSMITFVVSKIAVGIFAGGVVFATLLPEMHLSIGGTEINSFWMRAVVYNDAVQVTVLITGSALLTFYGLHRLGGWSELRHYCGSEMLILWRPITPPGVHATWAPVLETNASGAV